MKLQTIFSCAALTISMASMVVTLPKVSLAHDHDLLLAQDVQTIIAQDTSVTLLLRILPKIPIKRKLFAPRN